MREMSLCANSETDLLDAGVELRGGSGHGEVLLEPLRGHLDHLHEVHHALWRPRAVGGNLLKGLNGSKEVSFNNVSVAPVVNEIHLAQVHGEGQGDHVVALAHGRGQVLVVLEQVDHAGPDEAVDGVGVVLDLVASFH